jgi:benzoyl-CoA reductase subunit A
MGIVADLLDIPLEDLGPLSLEATDGAVPISSTCVVFARSEILAYLREGVPKTKVLAGACEALCSRVKGQLRRVGTEEEFVISGGIAKNVGVVKRLEDEIGMRASICFEPQIVGAVGAAIFGRQLAEKRGRKRRRKD